MKAQDIYHRVTEQIIEALEKDLVPWHCPWNAGFGLPTNLRTGRHYRGINVPLLWGTQMDRGFGSARWLTLRQANAMGGRIKKGSKGTAIIFWKMRTISVEQQNQEPEETLIPMARMYVVFNEEQVNGLPPAQKVVQTWDPHQEAEKLMALATVQHGGSRALYAPGPDIIQLPPREAFDDRGAYYATALHELTHWTGHSSRLNRVTKKQADGAGHAMEELVAEMGAAFLCASLGIQGQLQHAEYMAQWIDILHEDNRAIFRASSGAQKAVDFVRELRAEGDNVVS